MLIVMIKSLFLLLSLLLLSLLIKNYSYFSVNCSNDDGDNDVEIFVIHL